MSRADTETLAAHEFAPVRDPLVVVELELPLGDRFAAVARLVSAGLAARLDVEVTRIEKLKIAIDSVLRHPPSGPTVTLALTPTPDDLEVEVGPFAADGLVGRGLEDVLSTLVDETRTRRSGSDVWIAMRVARAHVVAGRSST